MAFIPVVVFLSVGEAGRQKLYSVITSSSSHYFCNCHVASLTNKTNELMMLLATSNRKPTMGSCVPQNWRGLEVRMANMILPFSSSRIEKLIFIVRIFVLLIRGKFSRDTRQGAICPEKLHPTAKERKDCYPAEALTHKRKFLLCKSNTSPWALR